MKGITRIRKWWTYSMISAQQLRAIHHRPLHLAPHDHPQLSHTTQGFTASYPYKSYQSQHHWRQLLDQSSTDVRYYAFLIEKQDQPLWKRVGCQRRARGIRSATKTTEFRCHLQVQASEIKESSFRFLTSKLWCPYASEMIHMTGCEDDINIGVSWLLYRWRWIQPLEEAQSNDRKSIARSGHPALPPSRESNVQSLKKKRSFAKLPGWYIPRYVVSNQTSPRGSTKKGTL